MGCWITDGDISIHDAEAGVNYYGPDSVMVRASASEAGGRGFDPGPRHTKDVKNGTSGCLAWRSAL